MKNTWKWIVGGGIIVVIVVAVIFSNPNLQKGFFQGARFTPASQPNIPVSGLTPVSKNIVSPIQLPLSDCHQGQFQIAFDRFGSPEGIQELLTPPGVRNIGKFVISTQGCRLAIRNLRFQWVNTQRQIGYNYRGPHYMNILNPSASLSPPRSLSVYFDHSNPALLCNARSDDPWFILTSSYNEIAYVTPGNPVTVYVDGTVFGQINTGIIGTPLEDSRYYLKLTEVSGIPVDFSFPVQIFPNSIPVFSDLVARCAR